ncbi:3,4-dihydroxy-2-butanone-4-phosphate synthase [Phycisphaera mikurensis]|uniref:3,4-dihydroxy-2-butanone 4-phosphate synthase n=1 Tax=Phycisphaera mikurensis (strain NBRC 102666 / KCTC 22515 / FYK2301M01) TaxID=1142394 RepID=I0IAB3_PHYMF|nr:3,4-dihydroxy-2-butanone-4-phosphate synthase [Phycisphaera mikurensis]MBB6441799.1 3,4-dihydroxy 2-butanone 4-phosphate synthase/GTP cyclohydrolase II [Phycisphaera mikurensis]BAM02201.1 putative 3,4-dihydroxy-2-butanone 4-phosphate synthase/GTP cyclohydrolase II [Phycisphaera mikurensis NBRC 102666]
MPASSAPAASPDPIVPVVEALRAGRIAVLIDDEQRENEGDLLCAAEHATPEVINFMLTHGRGMLFVALDGETCDRLDLPPQHRVNTTQRGTAYTLTVDAAEAFGVTTGVSTADRSATIRRLAAADAEPGDFDRPGHVQPLRAREGGTLVRAGHTEGLIDLMRLAGCRPAAVGIEVMNPDGTMARQSDLDRLCREHALPACSVADLIGHRLERDRLVRRVTERPLTNAFGDWTLIAYSSDVDPFPHVALVKGDVGAADPLGRVADDPEPVLVRMHSQNLLGDVFGDREQPSGETLEASMAMIERAGRGAVVYLRHEAMGRGLVRDLHTRRATLADGPPDPHDERVRPDPDRAAAADTPAVVHKSDHGIGCQILRDLGVRKLKLITRHPGHPAQRGSLAGFGLEIDSEVAPGAAG